MNGATLLMLFGGLAVIWLLYAFTGPDNRQPYSPYDISRDELISVLPLGFLVAGVTVLVLMAVALAGQ